MEIVLRDSVAADLPQLTQFLSPFAQQECILERSEAELAVLIEHGFVAERSTEIVGFAAIEIYSKKMAEVQAMAVSEDCRGQGVGRQLLQLCVERARREGILELMAITMSEELFRALGFDYALPNQKRALFLQTRDRDQQRSRDEARQ